MLYAVIMAGGAGTRFWPASRDLFPKQLLHLAGERSMLQSTVDRLGKLAPPDRVLIATRANLVSAVREQLPELPAAAILAEPCQRDTAACIGLAAVHVARRDPAATMVVLPSDHVITPDSEFQHAIGYAAQLATERPGRIVTFGIRPTYPAESFGYIERGVRLPAPRSDDPPTYQTVRFREKPQEEVARQYLEAGTFYWNSGIFVWQAKTILDALAEHQPALMAHLNTIGDAIDTPNYAAVLEREFTAIKGVSVDYAVMEHARDVVVVEAPFAWDDVGSWQAMARLHKADEHGNTRLGEHLGIDTAGTIVRSVGGHLIVTVGCRDMLVVHTPDATLVADKNQEEQIRHVVKQLRERGWTRYL